jgi:hypothetical protein
MRTPAILGEAGVAADARHWSVMATIPHYINEEKSEMRGIKPGWYATESDGNLSSGPFPSREQCLSRCTQPKN